MSTHTHTKTLSVVPVTKALVKKILENAHSFEWSIQGLGMLRLYLQRDLRLHVWADDARYEEVSTMHTHPWDFLSVVVAGRVRQHRFEHISMKRKDGDLFNEQRIRCGEGGGPVDTPQIVRLKRGFTEVYEEGETYSQEAHEIHSSFPEDGTVTVIHRSFHADTEHAYVYYEVGKEWVTAEPRPATDEEVARITANALEHWF